MNIEANLKRYREELGHELRSILGYWMNYAPDTENGGFVGRIDSLDLIDLNAPKGAVLNARILWSFSAAYKMDQDVKYRENAQRAYDYLSRFFLDEEFGGVYWTVDHLGQPLESRKQVYALAFVIYALSEYYTVSWEGKVKEQAKSLYRNLLEYAFDQEQGGYFEAFSRNWKPIEDLRLSEKDANEKKSMNTHLHVIEGFTNLYRIWPDEGLKQHIILLLDNFLNHILDRENYHLILFHDEMWNGKSDTISYGHDIEASWLLAEAAEVINNEFYKRTFEDVALKMAAASEDGVDRDGGLWYEYDVDRAHLVKEKHWWVQAEAMVGFFNAWEINGDEAFLKRSLEAWEFVKRHIIDRQNGEWFWGVDETGKVMPGEDKAGLWKCPYHNSRACMEIIRRIANQRRK